jgi:hypothetical protein
MLAPLAIRIARPTGPEEVEELRSGAHAATADVEYRVVREQVDHSVDQPFVRAACHRQHDALDRSFSGIGVSWHQPLFMRRRVCQCSQCRLIYFTFQPASTGSVTPVM